MTFSGWITKTLLALCVVIFLLMEFSVRRQPGAEKTNVFLFTSPVEKALLFDYPLLYQRIERFITLYGSEELEDKGSLSPGATDLLQKIERTSSWPGFYQIVLKKGWKGLLEGFDHYPTFEKIKKGQYWRFFSPCFLHGDLFHIFFNMLWLIVLGKQLEERLSPLKYIFFISLIAVFSNTAQYLMSGPNFVGFSGVLCGMLAFIWTRQRKAPWEGYQMDKTTLSFMALFIIGLSLLQMSSFLLEKTFQIEFSPNVANMAHLSGALGGYLLGSTSFFTWRVN